MSAKLSQPTPAPAVSLVDLGFMDARFKLTEVAAFLDRVQRHGQDGDFRVRGLKGALALLQTDQPTRARAVLEHFSDPTTEPIARAPMQGALGAWPGTDDAGQGQG